MTPDDFKAWRKANGWTRKEAAEYLGLSYSSIENYERGTRKEDDRPVNIPAPVQHAVALHSLVAVLQAKIGEAMKRREPYASGEIRIGEQRGKGNWVDVTDKRVKEMSAEIKSLEKVLAQHDPTYKKPA